MSFAKERPKSANSTGRPSPLSTTRKLKNFLPSELSSLTASNVPERKDSKMFCQHNNPTLKSPINDRKREFLLELKRREEIKATRNRLRGVLLQKLLNKFGNINKEKISKHVDAFVNSKLQISADDIINLEQAINNDSSNPKSNNESEEKTSDLSTSLKLPIRPASAGANRNIKTTCRCGCPGCGEHEKCITPIPLGSEWEALQIYQSVKGLHLMRQEEIKRKEKQAEMALILKEQMKEMEERRKKEKEADKRYLESINEDVKKYNLETDDIYKKEQEKFEKNRRIWTEQLEAKKEALRQEKEELQKSEQEELDNINRELEKERQRLLSKKQEEYRQHQERLLENLEKQRQKEIEKKLHQEENRRYAAEYNERIEREERQRQELLQKRIDSLERYSQWIDQGPVGQQKRLEEQQEEERIRRYQEIKQKNDEENERKKQEKIARNKQLMNEENDRMIQQKYQTSQLEKEKGLQEKLKSKEVADETLREAQRRREAELLQQKKYNEMLDHQINDRKNHIEDMNAIERAINKDDLTTIRCDPTYHSKVYQRLHRRISSANGRRKVIRPWV